MKLGRFVSVLVLLTAITFGFGSGLEADASGAPYVVKETTIYINPTCNLIIIEYSNLDWSFREVGDGCSQGPI
jgi:hypothetical protein